MTRLQEQMGKLLIAVMRNEKLTQVDLTPTEWQELLIEANVHQVSGLIYSAIDPEVIVEALGEEAANRWKKHRVFEAITQKKHIMEVKHLLQLFKAHYIDVILLKGLVIRSFYKIPELRVMCDADLLVHERDLKQIDELLIEEGYTPKEASAVHIQYSHPDKLGVEIHWTIRDERLFPKIDRLEEQIWETARSEVFEGELVKALSWEEQIVHLCTHMAGHLSVSGFGIRQLLDLALLTEAKRSAVDWQQVANKINEWQIARCTKAIFLMNQRLFDVEVPTEIEALAKVERAVVEDFIADIFECGVYGKRSLAHTIGNELAKDVRSYKNGEKTHVSLQFFRYIFPSSKQLSNRYSYAKKYPILLPFAWVHHLIVGIKVKKYKLRDGIAAYHISMKRNRLLKALKL